MNEFLRKYGSILIALILIYSFFNIHGYMDNKKSGIIKSDGLGYYSYLPAMFIYGDYTQSFIDKAFKNNYVEGGVPAYMQVVNERPVDKYFFGVAVLLYPFFLIAHFLSIYFHQPADGYSIFYQYFVGFAAIFYAFLACLFMSRLMKRYSASSGLAFFINSVMIFGTNLFHYIVVEPAMSHVYSYAMISGFLFFLKESMHSEKKQYLFGAFVTLGLLTLIRPVNALIILVIPFLSGNFPLLKKYFVFLLREYRTVLLASLAAALIVSLQCLMWYMQTDKWIVYAYTYERFYFNNPEVINILLSYRKGLFVWTPVLTLSLIGLAYLLVKNRFGFFSILVFLSVLIYVVSSWYMWFYGMSFGFRPLIEFFPLFAILLVMGFNWLQSRISKLVLTLFCLSCIYINQVQAYQYRNYILHWDSMSKDKYWKVFMQTGNEWRGYLWEYFVPGDLFGTEKSRYTMDFESPDPHWDLKTLKEAGTLAHSGKTVSEIRNNEEFGPTFNLGRDSVLASLQRGFIDCTLYIYDDLQHSPDSSFLVVSLQHTDGITYFYKMSSLDRHRNERGEWRMKGLSLRLPALENADDELKVYIWNPQRNNLLIDDVEITLMEEY